MFRPPENGLAERVACIGNWPGLLMWNMPYHESKLIWEYKGAKNWQNFTNVGCLSSYVPECADGSDVFVCPAEACKNDTRFFPCQDGKYCIHKNLLCDGYTQCEDGSGRIQALKYIYKF